MRNGRAVQTTNATRGRCGPKFWAWTVSIVVHLILLAVFGLAKFSQAGAGDKQQPAPMATVNQIKKAVPAEAIIPKPKVKKPTREQSLKAEHKLQPVTGIPDSPKSSSQDLGRITKPQSSQGSFQLVGSDGFSQGTEFFGAWTDERKICYVVDCSGSMRGMLSGVRRKLKHSIASLQQDQYFYIIFFGNARLFESGEGRMVRATQKAKSAACEFVDSIRPSGQTNALAALERAMQIHDADNRSPSVIYFLTDGFELTSNRRQRFGSQIANLLRRFAPKTKINTIGFWPQDSDRNTLEIIARQSGGEFVFVTDSDYE